MRCGIEARCMAKKMSNISNRILELAKVRGLKNFPHLAVYMGYGSPEIFYRLRRDPAARPSLEMIEDFAKKFPDLNLLSGWLITNEKENHLRSSRFDSQVTVSAKSKALSPKSKAVSPKSKMNKI